MDILDMGLAGASFIPGPIGMAAGGLSALKGMLGSASQARRLRQQRERMIAARRKFAMESRNQELSNLQRAGYTDLGLGLDTLNATLRSNEEGLANNNIYGSTGLLGRSAQMQRDLMSQLSKNQLEGKQGIERQYNNNLNSINDMEYNATTADLDTAMSGEANSAAGLAKYLGSLNQMNQNRIGISKEKNKIGSLNRGMGDRWRNRRNYSNLSPDWLMQSSSEGTPIWYGRE